MISANSRYANSTVVTVEKDGGNVGAIVPSAALSYSFQYVSHLVIQGDRIDALSSQFYGDPTLWWKIAQANPEIMYWDNLVVGTILRVPQV